MAQKLPRTGYNQRKIPMRLDRQTTPAGSAPMPPGTHMVNRPAPRPERDLKPAPSRGTFLSSSRGRPLRMVVSAQLAHALMDLALIGIGQTVVLALIHERLGIQNSLEAAAVVGVSLLVTMTFLY